VCARGHTHSVTGTAIERSHIKPFSLSLCARVCACACACACERKRETARQRQSLCVLDGCTGDRMCVRTSECVVRAKEREDGKEEKRV